jgi:hypothetical protein
MGPGAGRRSATDAGVRKMPEPIVDPTTTATALHKPIWRFSEGEAPPDGSVMRETLTSGAALRHQRGVRRERQPVVFGVAGPLADVLFFLLVVAIIIAHAFVLRSTVRGMRADPRARGVWEWIWAVLPAVALAVLFVWTWGEMHPGSISITLPADRLPPGGIGT